MNANLGPAGVWIAIAAMAVVTYGIRISGFWLMGRIPVTPRVRAILNALPGAVIVATIAPLAVRGGTAAVLAIGTSLLVMALTRKDILAVVCGIVVAASARYFAL
jgi:uncharacterized membrane protein